MILKKGNMWDRFGKVDLFLFTSNPIVNKQGLAVMGRGIAKEVAYHYPQIRRDFANRLRRWTDYNLLPYNIGVIGTYDGQDVGFFMVKDHWRNPASLSIISESVDALCDRVSENVSWFLDYTVALNFPGIGNGRLRREDVLPIIERLPDSVEVWEYE